MLPHGLSFDSAASLLCVFLTAYYAAAELAHVRKGDTVLVHSASGATLPRPPLWAAEARASVTLSSTRARIATVGL